MTFYFAWVDPGTAFNASTHSVEDENVFAFEITHSEGDIPMLSIDIKNPRVQLLDGSHKLWAWLSRDSTPLFFGRLVAIPEDLHLEIVTMQFIARPSNYDTQKQALAATMKSFPYYDYIWLREDKLDDPDTVLEARAELWHVDRTSHTLTSSSINVGEDGTVAYGGDFIYDSLTVRYGSPPLRRVSIAATISWDQVANGLLDFTNDLKKAFDSAGSPNGRVSSYTGQGLQSDWPKFNDNFNGGWTVGKVRLKRQDGRGTRSRFKDVKCDSAQPLQTQTNDNQGSIFNTSQSIFSLANIVTTKPATARFFIWEFSPYFPLNYDVKRKRIETVNFTLEADVQSIVVEPGEDEAESISLSSKVVGVPLDPEDPTSVPIGDVRRRSYLKTDRGHNSVSYLIMLARANLLARARAVTVEFTVPFNAGIALSCRKNASIVDPRLPDGQAFGKVIEYHLTANGDGQMLCTVAIGCTIGQGNTVSAAGGTPDYVDEGYVNIGYQTYTGANIVLLTNQVTYTDYDNTTIVDDGLEFIGLTTREVTNSFDVINGEDDQAGVLSTTYPDIPAAIEAVNAVFTEVVLDLVPLTGGPFETPFVLTVSDLMIPKTIELQ